MIPLLALLAAAAAPIQLENEFVRLRVNPGPEEAGRFALDTTGGDPSREEDDGKRLVFGSTLPWSSFTVVWVDGSSWVFGGATRTGHHAAQDLPAGRLVSGPSVVTDLEGVESVVTVYAFGGVEVSQTLSFARGGSTGVFDTLSVRYGVSSADGADHRVGVMMMLDTMLGENDGAPLRAAGASDAAGAETCWEGDAPPFWQAFDSLEAPTVMAQGTVSVPGVPAPDRFMFSNWGKLSHAGWNPSCEPGLPLVREGDFEVDTAVALQWSPMPVSPGAPATFGTDYGLAGVEVESGDLSLGLSAPSDLPPSSLVSEPALVVGYVQNTSGFVSRDTRLSLVSEDGLEIAGAAHVSVGDLEPGGVRQVTWRISNPGLAGNVAHLVLHADSDTLPPNAVRRRIRIPAPARLTARAVGLPVVESAGIQHRPGSFAATLEVTNPGSVPSPSGAVTVRVEGPLDLLDGPTRPLPRLSPGGVARLSWRVAPRVEGEGEVAISWSGRYGERQIEAAATLDVPGLPPHVRHRASERYGVVTHSVEGVRLPGFLLLEREWEIHGECDFAGAGGIAETPGYAVEATCDGSRLLLVVTGDGTPVPPLAGLARVYHGGDPAAPWTLVSERLVLADGETTQLEE